MSFSVRTMLNMESGAGGQKPQTMLAADGTTTTNRMAKCGRSRASSKRLNRSSLMLVCEVSANCLDWRIEWLRD